jgi:hypothetical protein
MAKVKKHYLRINKKYKVQIRIYCCFLKFQIIPTQLFRYLFAILHFFEFLKIQIRKFCFQVFCM